MRAAGWKLLYDPRCELVHLSAPSGGVRVEDALRGETWRFRNTAYFVLKHRGMAQFPRFALTFGAISLARAARWRDPSVVAKLAAAVKAGISDQKLGPDQALPRVG